MWLLGLTEAAQFPEKEYFNGIFVAMQAYEPSHKRPRPESVIADRAGPPVTQPPIGKPKAITASLWLSGQLPAA
jgi:hypothetical protein